MSNLNYKSPIYNKIYGIRCWACIGQDINPNSLTESSFNALQISILNNGYLFPVIVNRICTREEDFSQKSYDEIKDILEYMLFQDKENGYLYNNSNNSLNIKNNKYLKYVEFQVVDGQQRSSIIKLGAYYFFSLSIEERREYINKWKNGNIPTEPGKECLMYIGFREYFKIPCLILESKSKDENMSTTILLNTAKGSHDFHIIKDIVTQCINEGKTKKWISKNFYINEESIERICQINNVADAFEDIENIELSWVPEESFSYKQKIKFYLDREALKYLKEKNIDIPYAMETKMNITIQNFAEQNGWDKTNTEQSVVKEIDLAPNGTRRDGRLVVGYIPK